MDELEKKEIKAEILTEKVTKNPELIPDMMEGFLSDTAAVKFKSAKVLVQISEKRPELLYPHFDFFAEHLSNKNTILKWNAMDVIANLTPVDRKMKFDRLFKKFYSLLHEGSLISAGHVVSGSAIIAKAKPHLEEKITEELLNIEKIHLPNKECRNIIKGHAIKAFDRYFDQIKNKDRVMTFVKKELQNTRQATNKKAERFLRKWEK